MRKNSSPLVSIIIPTKNEEKTIKRCLESIIHQPYKKIEMIVVDNYSTDKTKQVTRKYTRRVYNVAPERSAQRNFGAKKIAKGKYLLFLDSDMSVSSGLIRAAVTKMEKESKIVGLYVSEIVQGRSFWSRVRRFERWFYNSTVVDGLRFMRRDAFLKTGGFDEDLYACEDWDMDKRMKKLGKVAFIKASIFHHELKFNIKNYLDKKYYYSANFNVYINKWGKDDPDIRKQFGPGYRLFWVFVEDGKWKRLVQHPWLAVCMLFLRLLASWKYILIRLKVDL